MYRDKGRGHSTPIQKLEGGRGRVGCLQQIMVVVVVAIVVKMTVMMLFNGDRKHPRTE